MASMSPSKSQGFPLKIVGSTKFGRYEKMSSEQTFNMIISDGWLVPFGGWSPRSIINYQGEGRGIYSSAKNNHMYAVIDGNIWSFDSSLSRTVIGVMDTFTGDVFIDENNVNQIAFSDGESIYIYNYLTSSFVQLTSAILGFKPGYLTFQDSRFISPDTDTNQYRLSEVGNGLSFPFDAQHVGEVSTKPTRCVACVRFPARGNLLLVMGQTVGEQWMDVGAQLFPYQRSQSTNLDYGCINPATIATNQDIVCWVAINEQSGLAIMSTTGSEAKKISTDGIDFKLTELKYPSNCYGFMVRLDGHLCYVVSWPKDNLSYLYDFNTEMFFTLTDENMDVFIVKRVAFFNNTYYFVSLKDGNLYELNSRILTYDYGNAVYEIPQIRIVDSLQLPDQSRFMINVIGFTIQSGEFDYHVEDTDNIPHIDLSISRDGGVNYGNNVKRIMRPQAFRKNKLTWTQAGEANDMVLQFRFHALNGRFICSDGEVQITRAWGSNP